MPQFGKRSKAPQKGEVPPEKVKRGPFEKVLNAPPKPPPPKSGKKR